MFNCNLFKVILRKFIDSNAYSLGFLYKNEKAATINEIVEPT